MLTSAGLVVSTTTFNSILSDKEKLMYHTTSSCQSESLQHCVAAQVSISGGGMEGRLLPV